MIDFGTDINAALAAGQAKLYALLDLAFSTPDYLTDCDIPLYYNGHRYRPSAIKMPTLKQKADLSADSVAVMVGNADLQMAANLQNSDVTETVAIIRFAAVDEAHQVVDVRQLRHCLLDEWSLNEKEASLQLADERILWHRNTMRKITGVCWWPFKGTECGYAGGAPRCDRSHAICNALGNTANYGGHRFLPGLADKEIRWGTGQTWRIRERDGHEVLSLPYGRCRLRATRTYFGVDGQQRMHIIALLGEGPVSGLVTIGGQPQIWLSKTPWSRLADIGHWEFFTGTADQAVCATLRAALPEWNDPLRYTCYLYLRLEDDDRIPNNPDIEALIDGLLVYDPDAQSTSFSANCALCAHDHITRPRTRGGCGLAASRMNVSSVADSRDYCTAMGWEFNAPVKDDDRAADNLQLILDCFRGAIVYSDGLYKMKYRELAVEQVSMDLSAGDLVPGSVKMTSPQGLDRPTSLLVEFINALKGYEQDQLPVPATSLPNDDGAVSIELPGLSADKAGDMGLYMLERTRWNKRVEAVGQNKCWRLEPLDLIRITLAEFGWDQLLLRVEEANTRMDMTAQLACVQEDLILYDQVYNLDPDPAHDDPWDNTTLPDPNDSVASVINVSHTEATYHFRGEVHTRLDVRFDRPAETYYPWWEYAEIWVRLSTETQWKFVTPSRGDFRLDPVQEGVTYLVKMRSVNRYGIPEDFDSAYTISHLVAGKSNLPGDLAGLSAVAVGDKVVVKAQRLNEPAIRGYEIRWGEVWESALFMKLDMDPTLTLIGVRPGLHMFWGNPIDNAGQYAANPVSAQCRVFLPPGLTLHQSWSWDFNAIGTHDNTEYAYYANEDCLRCAHTGAVLTGKWTSPTRDLGVVQPVRIFGDFRTSFVSGATTFGGVAPHPTTFADIGALTRTFREIFQPTAAGHLRASLFFSTDGSSWDSKEGLEILCAEVEGRWIYVEVEITDPTLDARLYLKELNMWAYTGMQGI